MNMEAFFLENVKAALQNDPPGTWVPRLPKKCIRMSSGFPAPSLVPSEEIKAAVGKLLEEERDRPLQYVGSRRIKKLKQQIHKRLLERGIAVQENELLITSGACQAIDLIARIMLDDKKIVVVEAPAYMEALEIFQNYTSQIISIQVDEHGLQTNQLAARLAERKRSGLSLPCLLYTIPTFQNPTGTTMTPERRKQLLELANEYNFLILEDDAYGELSFGERPLPLKALDEEGRVLHVGSFSKIVAPGMRIGWIAGKQPFLEAAAWFKKDLDHPFAQAAMAVYLENINLDERLTILKEAYRERCETIIRALEQFLPAPVTWYVPEGGYFVWVYIPGADTAKLLEKALATGVSFVPGKFFFIDQQFGSEFLRLSFSYADEEDIIKGVKLLGQLITT